jgi:glycosyltransferase involved in cell wall biosynthesis
MASNPATPFGIEFGHVTELHDRAPASFKKSANGVAQLIPRSAFSRANASSAAALADSSVSPFAALTARHGRPLRIALLSDFTRISYANGAAFQTRFLYQELRRCGHEVTLIGPHDPTAGPGEIPEGTVGFPSAPCRAYPGLHIPMPLAPWVFDPNRWQFDLCFAQTTSMLMEFGVWLREMKGVPLLCVNTTHLAATYETLIPEKLAKVEAFHAGVNLAFRKPFDRLFAGIYNNTDGLVVLSEGLRGYWRERGVTAPIHVIPRTVQPELFDRPIGDDPYTHLQTGSAAWRGARLLCAGRLTREKYQHRLIPLFARHIAPFDREATLTLVGDGPDTELLKQLAQDEGVGHRVFFVGEVPFTKMADYYAYADLFVHTSLSETYGNVMGEALWCGTPMVAFADGMGASYQIKDGVNGVLIAPGTDEASQRDADVAFARAVLDLLDRPEERARLGRAASKMARERCSPRAVQERIAHVFQAAQDHAKASHLRPAVHAPKPVQWLTTFRRFRSWTTFNGSIILAGAVRKGAPSLKKKNELHPQIGK